MEKQHGKWVQNTVAKSELAARLSFLLITVKASESVKVNLSDMQNLIDCLLTRSLSDDKYSNLKIDIFNASYSCTQLSQKQKTFRQFFSMYFENLRLNFQDIEKKR